MAGEINNVTYADIDSSKVVNKEGLLELCNQIKTAIASAGGGSGGSSNKVLTYIGAYSYGGSLSDGPIRDMFLYWSDIETALITAISSSFDTTTYTLDSNVFNTIYYYCMGESGDAPRTSSIFTFEIQPVSRANNAGVSYAVKLITYYWDSYGYSPNTARDRNYIDEEYLLTLYYYKGSGMYQGWHLIPGNKTTAPRYLPGCFLTKGSNNDELYLRHQLKVQNNKRYVLSYWSTTAPNSGASGGTSLPSDPSSDGTYVLQNTISSGASTLSWTTPSSGGTTYTAGTGISITNGVISLDLQNANGVSY